MMAQRKLPRGQSVPTVPVKPKAPLICADVSQSRSTNHPLAPDDSADLPPNWPIRLLKKVACPGEYFFGRGASSASRPMSPEGTQVTLPKGYVPIWQWQTQSLGCNGKDIRMRSERDGSRLASRSTSGLDRGESTRTNNQVEMGGGRRSRINLKYNRRDECSPSRLPEKVRLKDWEDFGGNPLMFSFLPSYSHSVDISTSCSRKYVQCLRPNVSRFTSSHLSHQPLPLLQSKR